MCLGRNSVMFNNELMADIHFLVGPSRGVQRLPGHRVNPITSVIHIFSPLLLQRQ